MNDILKFNAVFYNEDAINFIPLEEFDSIFMCPPYDVIEDYSYVNDFKVLMGKIRTLYLSSNAKTMGVIIREDMVGYVGFDYDIKEIVNNTINHFKTKKINEYLYIWEKK